MLIKRYNTKEVPWSEGILGFSNKSIFQADEQYLLFNFHAFGDNDQSRYTKYLHDKFPYANIYKYRKPNEWSKLGGIDIFGDGKDKRYIVNMYTQMYSGRPKMLKDQFPKRMRFFIHAMFQVYKIQGVKSIAMQQKMADMAYYWPQYLEVIKKFAAKFPHVKSIIYQGNFMQQARAAFRITKRKINID